MSLTFEPMDGFPPLWYDDLDVLGSDAYQRGPGPHVDPGMEPAWRTELFEALRERDLVLLSFYAQGFALLGYPFGAQALRNRAAALAAWMDPSVPPVVAGDGQEDARARGEAGELAGGGAVV